MDAAENVKKPVRVTIFNQSYSVLTSGDPADTVQLAHEIDELMASIARRGGNLDSTRTAVLACLHLADKLRRTEHELSGLKDSLHRKTRDLTQLLDQVMPLLDQPNET